MAKVAIIETKRSRNNYKKLFNNEFEFDLFTLTSKDVEKVLKADVDICFNPDEYDWIILVGSEPFKYYTKNTSITSYTGKVVNDKYLPTINPAMIKFKPEAEKPWLETRNNIINYISGKMSSSVYDTKDFIGIEDEELAIEFLDKAIKYKSYDFFAIDTETTALYPRNGYIIGISISYAPDSGAYISTDCISEEVENKLRELILTKLPVFHNSKFDISMLNYHFGLEFPEFEDTMLLHYTLDEVPGTHGLKDLALKYTKYGDYEKNLTEWKSEYCRKNRIKQEDFTYDLIPFDIIKTYAAIDTAVTFELYQKFQPLVYKNPKFKRVYEILLKRGTETLVSIQNNGVPFDKSRLLFAQKVMEAEIEEANKKLYSFNEVVDMQLAEGKPFNPNSVVQLRKLLFDYIGLNPTGILTGKNLDSTNKEVLAILADQHEVPAHILSIRQSGKIKNTYLDKIIPQLDSDSRLRTGFNLHSTTSGRLSSSGKLNMQQLPRDNPAVKGCIKAGAGNKIVSVDLATAEMWVVAALANDLELQNIFRKGGDFHSSITKKILKLDCSDDDIKTLYKKERQAAKAISFGILYGAGADKIANTAGISVSEARTVIKEYFSTFWRLGEWIEEVKEFILENAYIYSAFGRKRRLPNVRSENKGIVGHEVRSGLNFTVQSVASDINLLACIDMQNYIVEHNMQAKIFAMVHDSILAEVPQTELEEYNSNIAKFIQMDRGVSIIGAPIGYDIEIGDDYSFGKFTNLYGDNI